MANSSEEKEPISLGSLRVNPLAAYIFAGLLSGAGVNVGIDSVKDPRPDPYTGADGERDRAASLERDGRLEARLEVLEFWRDEHTKFGYERTIEWNRKMDECMHRCEP